MFAIRSARDINPDPYDENDRENQRAVLAVLRTKGISAPSDLMQHTRLCRTTVLKIADRLVEKGLAIHLGQHRLGEARQPGKPPHLYDFNASCAWSVAISIKHGVLDMAITDALSRIRQLAHEDLLPDEEIESILARLSRFMEQASMSPGCRGIPFLGLGIATQGIVDSASGRVLKVLRFPSWPRPLDLAALIARTFGDTIAVKVDNNARLAAVAECHRHRDYRGGPGGHPPATGKDYCVDSARREPGCRLNLIHLIIGSGGLGAGIVVDGIVLRGRSALAGEIGHMIINPAETEDCSCGNRGCFEQQMDPARVARRAGLSGSRDLSMLFRQYREGRADAQAESALKEAAHWMAVGLHNLRLMFDPELITISGPYRDASTPFIDQIYREAATLGLTSLGPPPAIAFSDLGDNAALMGASLLIADGYFGPL